jgi:hypothetical protein
MLTSGLKRAAGGALLLGGAALGLVGWLIIRAVRARK